MDCEGANRRVEEKKRCAEQGVVNLSKKTRNDWCSDLKLMTGNMVAIFILLQ